MPMPIFLTNHFGRDRSPTWAKSTYTPERRASTPWQLINNLLYAFRLFRLRANYSAVILGGGAQEDLIYLILQGLWPLNTRPVIKLECLWYKSSPFKQLFKKYLFRFVDKVVSRYVVYCRHEINRYSSTFGLPREKFIFIPYHTTAVGEFSIKNGDYIFSGGNFARDYKTLALAVEGIDVKVIIACTNKKALQDIRFPENVKVIGVSHEEFMELMAKSWINVISLEQGLLHSGGQQTFLNAMAMGKPVIVNDPEGARDYIENGVDGILVPPADPAQLKEAILSLKNNYEFSKKICESAQIKAALCDTENHLAQIVKLAKALNNRSMH